MTEPAAAHPEPAWIVERRRVSAAFARFYAALAVVAVVVSSLDLFSDQVVQLGSSSFTRRYGSVWWLTAVDRGGVAGFGAALLLVLVLLLVLAGLRPTLRPGLPAAIALIGGALGALVGFRVGVRQPVPELAEGGQATVALAVLLVVIGTVHAVRLLFGAQPELDARPAGATDRPRRPGR